MSKIKIEPNIKARLGRLLSNATVIPKKVTNAAIMKPARSISNKYAKSIDANAIHGSDSDDNAEIEGRFFFTAFERF